MTILVTGGAGYIGSHFVKKLINTDPSVQVIVLDNFSQGRNNVIHNDRIRYHEADLRNPEQIAAVFRTAPIDAVVHFAAFAIVPHSVMDPREYYINNVIGGLNLFNVMLDHNVKRIISSSSCAVYGEAQSEILAEDHPKNPINPYGRMKLTIEQILQDYHQAYGMCSTSLRYFCAAGCDASGTLGEWHDPETHVIPAIIETVLGRREMFYVAGNDYATPDGSGIRDYIHVNDLANAHVLALQKLFEGEARCNAYNLGINKGFSVMELIDAVERVSGKKVPYQIKERRPGDPSRLVADASKAYYELGWQAEYTSIDSIITTAYRFFEKRA